MYLVVIRFVIKTYVVRVDKSNYNTLHKNDLFNKFFCKFEIEIIDNNNQIYMSTKTSTMKSHVFSLFVIHYF